MVLFTYRIPLIVPKPLHIFLVSTVFFPYTLGLEDWKDEYFAISLWNSMPCFGLFRHSFLINFRPQAPQKIASRTEEQQCAAGQGALGLWDRSLHQKEDRSLPRENSRGFVKDFPGWPPWSFFFCVFFCWLLIFGGSSFTGYEQFVEFKNSFISL